VAGTWKDLTDNVNLMANNLTSQVRNIADVTTAVAKGDLSRKITVDVRGEILELKNTINTMVDQLNGFAAEVTRGGPRSRARKADWGGKQKYPVVARHLEGPDRLRERHGHQPNGPGAQYCRSDHGGRQRRLSRKITVDVKGEILQLKEPSTRWWTASTRSLQKSAVWRAKLAPKANWAAQAEVVGVAGTWKDLTDNVNLMAANLTGQVRNIAEVATAVARGDLSRKITWT
jgi:HAMP domain-containing protein